VTVSPDHTQTYTTLGWTPLEEGSAPLQRLLPDKTRNSQQTDIHVLIGIRTRNPSKMAATRIDSQLFLILLHDTDILLHVSTTYMVIFRPFKYMKHNNQNYVS
jgi:hypothetical protein